MNDQSTTIATTTANTMNTRNSNSNHNLVESSHSQTFIMNHNVSNDDDVMMSPLLHGASDENNNATTSIDNPHNEESFLPTNTTSSSIHCNKKCSIFVSCDKISKCIQNIMDIYSDQSGSCQNLTKGLSLIILTGSIIGILTPKNTDLPTPIYQYISSMIGYTYFLSWSYSFIPQIITNYQNKSTLGLSTDASILAVLNYTCYTIYNVYFFWDGTIREEYKQRHGEHAEITVVSNDVAFAIIALVCTIIILSQIYMYGGYRLHNVSKSCLVIVGVTIGICSVQSMFILWKIPGFYWIDFLYTMATVKLILTIMTYIPQILLNYKRKSTDGEFK